jgi:hypothetical protein
LVGAASAFGRVVLRKDALEARLLSEGFEGNPGTEPGASTKSHRHQVATVENASMQLAAVESKSKPTTDRLTGRAVELPNDRCKCGSNVAIIDHDRQLSCRSCGRLRGYLSKHTADWITEVIKTVGTETITIRGPSL